MSKQFFKDKDTVAEIHAARASAKAVRAAEQRWLSRRDLHDGEVVEWEGRPYTGIAFSGWDLYLIPWTIFASVLILRIWAADRGTESAPPLVLMVVVFYLVIGRFVVDSLHRRRLRYTITNQRVMIVSSWPTSRFYALKRQHVEGAFLRKHREDRGTIFFSQYDKWYGWNDDYWSWQQQDVHACLGQPPMLFRIPDAARVFALLQAPPGYVTPASPTGSARQ